MDRNTKPNIKGPIIVGGFFLLYTAFNTLSSGPECVLPAGGPLIVDHGFLRGVSELPEGTTIVDDTCETPDGKAYPFNYDPGLHMYR